MVLKNEEISEKFVAKGIWKLKDISEANLEKRQREVINFIKELILGEEESPK